MHLNKKELPGFKSFSSKTTREFKDGITAIVGPNGSGKSNVSDAIRWALGEQSSKMLRGQKMEDVIFLGSNTKKPLGMAEVCLYFDNADKKIPLEYSEVSIKRRVYRSGDSEYYINNSSCRLKDIRDLFMDTGIGKDGYSIIGQGKIDEILSNKPEERRFIFEEAAGIIKYKSRKEETERKLRKTDDNISRVNDILEELNSRYEYLESESKKAVDFKDLEEKIKEMELDLIYRELDGLYGKIGELEDSKRSREELVKNDLKTQDSFKAEILKYQLEKQELEEKLGEIESSYEEKNHLYLKSNEEKILLEEKIRYIEMENIRLDEEIKTSLLKIDEHKKGHELRFEENESLSVALREAQAEYEKIKAKSLETVDLLEKKELLIEGEKTKISDYHRQINDKKSEEFNLKSFKGTISDQFKNIDEESKDLISHIEINTEKKAQIVLEIQRKKEDRQKKEESIDKIFSELEELDKNQGNIKLKLEKANIDLNLNISQYNMNMNLQENYDGYYKSVKALMVNSKKDKELSKHIVGVVADLIEIEDGYTKAIETAMGSSVQNIVTRDADGGRVLIDYLRKNNLGRATFLPINIIKSRKMDISRLDFEKFGVLGLASDIVSYREEYRNIVENILGRIIIVDSMENAISLAKFQGHTVKIVTLEGDVINPGGAMTGGSTFARGSNILNRKSIIKDLEDKKEALLSDRKALEGDLSASQVELKKLAREKDLLTEDLKALDIGLNNYKNEVNLLEMDLERLETRLGKLNEDINYFSDERKSMDSKLDQISLEIKTMEDEYQVMKNSLSKLSDSYREERQAKEKLLEDLTERKIEIQSLEEKHRYNLERLDDVIKLNEELSREVQEKKSSMERRAREYIELNKHLEETREVLVGLGDTKKILEDEKSEIKLKLDTFIEKLNELKEKSFDLTRNIDKNKDKINLIELELAKKTVHRENYSEELRERFGLDYKLVDGRNYLDMEYEVLKKEIKNYTAKKDKLGIVNLGAIEEFNLVKERLEFINNQIDDLEEAKKRPV